MEKTISRSPATGQVLREIDSTPLSAVPGIFQQARAAQTAWAALSPKRRAKVLLDFRERLIERSEAVIDTIVAENGKPRFEALSAEILTSVDLITYFCKKAPALLRPREIRLHSPILLHRRSTLYYHPLGVVAVIAPWNYPFFLPLGEIVMALVCGNAVVFKPSEITPQIGLLIQELFAESGLPEHLLQTVIGDGKLGEAIIRNHPDKIFFTGSVETGKRIMQLASESLTPIVLELGGKDPMVVLPGADLDFASSCALWGTFTNAGQMCASTERILVHEKDAAAFQNLLMAKMQQLRVGTADIQNTARDLSFITAEKQKTVYDRQLQEARARSGVQVLTGGEFNTERTQLAPTLVGGPEIAHASIRNEESFGPIATLETYRTIDQAIQLANQSRYGLCAAVIGEDLGLARRVAAQLQAGTVTINEVSYTAGVPETPWGGRKDSGFGRKHSEMGLYEFVHMQHLHAPRLAGLTFKSAWWFPYTPWQYRTFYYFLQLYRKSWIQKAWALPEFLRSFIQMLKSEKRL